VGFPLVLKIDTDEVVHKSDIGGVMVGIKNEKELSKAVTEMRRKVEAAGISMKKVGYLVQEQSAAGKEVILGVLQDSKFGPLLMFGMGGTYVEILRDVSFRVMPVTDVDALDMVQSIKAYPLLEGVRGEEGVDVGFIVECIGRLAQLISEVDGIYEMDINPIIVTSDRSTCRAVDARIHVAAPPR